MAFAVRYTATVKVDLFKYQVDIYEEDYAGAAINGTLCDELFTITYAGDGDNIYEPIRASQATINLWVQKGSSTETFVNEIVDYHEKRYLVNIQRGPCDGSLSPFWRGIVVQDNFSIELDCSYAFKLTATDGLSRLKEKFTPFPAEASTNLVERLIFMLEETGYAELYNSASDDYLTTSCRYFEDDHTATSIDPLAHTNYLNPNVHNYYSNENTTEQRSYYAVIESICRSFNLRLMQSGGHWWLTQPFLQTATSLTTHTYQRDYDPGADPGSPSTPPLLANTTTAASVTVNNTSRATATKGAIIYGALWLIAPSYKRVDLTFKFNGSSRVYANQAADLSTLTDTGYTGSSSSGYLHLESYFNFKYSVSTTGNPQQPFDIYVSLRIGSYYWDGTQWTTTSGAFKYNTVFEWVSNGAPVDITTFIQVTTANLPAGGTVYVQVYAQPQTITGITLTPISDTNNIFIDHLGSKTQYNGRLYSASNSSGNSASSLVYDYGETYLADNDQGQYNKLQVWDGAAWVDSDSWAKNALTGGSELLELAVKGVLSAYIKPAYVLDAELLGGAYYPHEVVDWDLDSTTRRLIMQAAEFNAAAESWRGTWQVIIEAGSGITIGTPVGLEPYTLPPPPVNPVLNSTVGDTFLVGKTSGSTSGTITSVSVESLTHGEIKAGDFITLLNPVTGQSHALSVTTDTAVNDTSISVESAALGAAYPSGSLVIVSSVQQLNKINSGTGLTASDVLTKTNTTAYTPTADYHPATKKFVDDSVSAAGGGDMLKSVYDTGNNGVVDNSEQLNGQGPAYYLSTDNHTSGTTNKVFTAAEQSKLSGIEAGAEVNTVDSVNTQTGAVMLDADDIDDTSTAHKFVSAAQRTAIDTAVQPGDLGTLATLNTVNNSNWSGTDLSVVNGGTGSSTAAGARTNLGLVIGTNVQAYSAVLQNTTASFTTAQESKLAGIEAGADVTDATNVAAAGAVMNTGNETVAGIKTFSAFPVTPSAAPTTDYQVANKKYVDDSITAAGGYTDENAQDAVGTILTDSAEIDFTYNDAAPSITAAIVAGSIDETKLDASVNASLDLADSASQPGHTHTASEITDFDTEVANNSAVAANTAKVSNATHTGDVTGSTALTIANNAVSNAKLADMAVNTIKGRITTGTGDPQDLTAAQVRTIINVADGATANQTDAYLLSRANHTGTQDASTITGQKTSAFISDWLEAVQDAIGGSLLDGSTINFTYNDTTGQITAEVNPLEETSLDSSVIARLFTDAAQKTDLTDGGDSTLHYHSADRNRANHTGSQTASTISDFSTEVRATKMQALEEDVSFSISASYNDSVIRLYDACTTVTLGTALDGVYFELYNDTGSDVTIVNVAAGANTLTAGDFALVRGVKNVGWVCKIV